MHIQGMAAIITGGGSGLGAATARHLASAGAKVAVLDINMDQARGVAAEIGGIALECDVTSDLSAEAAIGQARTAHGPARISVCCAGISESRRMVDRNGPAPLAHHQRLVDVHLVGTYNICRLAAADMAACEPLPDTGERGVLINTASIAGFDGPAGAITYDAVKAAIAAMSLPMARELSRHAIRVMAIAPGIFKTPMAAGLRQDYIDEMTQAIPFPKRFGEPAEYARMVETILTTPMLNGETIRIDGGLRMT
ncbi:MAG: SDR family NAD(P)-dependent oxidoreductase [Alphaproteobacteria bacterium]|nr:SDR family NAD(P)-dependent oxidoreductase [Alphaproteobacteria bacterium]